MKTTDEIYQEMKALFCEKSGASLREGGDMALRLYTAAAQLYTLWAQADFLEKQAFPQTAAGEYLDRHAQSRGLTRTPAATAAGTLTFSRKEAAQTATEIPKGCVCATLGGVQFATTETGWILSGETAADVPAAALREGAAGNAAAGSVVQMLQPPAGVVGCTNESAFSGGRDEESDESLRSRLLNSYRKLPNGANAAYYETQVLDIPGVAAVEVTPKARGLGTVDIVVAGTDGVPDGSLLQTVQDTLDSQREICVDIQVKAPSTQAVDVTVYLQVQEGYDLSEVSARVSTALNGYFSGTLLGAGVLRARLGNLVYNVPGVANYNLVKPAADVTPAAGVLPVAGTLTVGAM